MEADRYLRCLCLSVVCVELGTTILALNKNHMICPWTERSFKYAIFECILTCASLSSFWWNENHLAFCLIGFSVVVYVMFDQWNPSQFECFQVLPQKVNGFLFFLVRKGIFCVLTQCLKFIIQPQFTHLIYFVVGVELQVGIGCTSFISFNLFHSKTILLWN